MIKTKWLACFWQSAAVAALFAGCSGKVSSNVDEQNAMIEISESEKDWIGKQLNLPTDVGYFTSDGDSVNSVFPTDKFKIIRYIGKKECVACQLHMNIYPNVLADLQKATNCPVGFVCIINPTDMNEIRRLLWRDNKAGLTMWIDEADSLNRLNGFPDIGALQTFLVDGDNRVLAVGDPAVNPRVMKLFQQILSGKM